jgi:hypothetical protein
LKKAIVVHLVVPLGEPQQDQCQPNKLFNTFYQTHNDMRN